MLNLLGFVQKMDTVYILPPIFKFSVLFPLIPRESFQLE